MAQPGGNVCQVCEMDPRYTHTASQHVMAEALRGPLLSYIQTDAFSSERERVLTYSGLVHRFDVPTTARKVGRVLDAVECMLVADGWPREAAAGITAYVVNSSGKDAGRPGVGWYALWNMNAEDAREGARSYMRGLVLDEQ